MLAYQQEELFFFFFFSPQDPSVIHEIFLTQNMLLTIYSGQIYPCHQGEGQLEVLGQPQPQAPDIFKWQGMSEASPGWDVDPWMDLAEWNPWLESVRLWGAGDQPCWARDEHGGPRPWRRLQGQSRLKVHSEPSHTVKDARDTTVVATAQKQKEKLQSLFHLNFSQLTR